MFTTALDLTRATGYHRVTALPDRTYIFGTTDAKLRLEGVVAMLDFLREQSDALGLKWSGVMHFSGSNTVVRDPRLDAAWVEEHVPRIIEVGRMIARRPYVATRTRRVRAVQGVPDVAATAALVRREPEVMERFVGGIIEFNGERWSPRQIVKQRIDRHTDTPGNRRATRLLTATLALVRRCEDQAPNAALFSEWRRDLSDLLRLAPFREIRRSRGHMRINSRRSLEERTDHRYAEAREKLDALLRDRHWDPSEEVAQEWAYAELADRVYQTFVAFAVAAAFDLKASSELGQAGPHFVSDDYELWVDAVPSPTVLRNWRAQTSTPMDARPDLLLRRRYDGHIALLDAKYRNNKDRATPGSIAEVQLYLQAFECRQISVVFPPAAAEPPWESHVISDGRYSISEIPLRPSDHLPTYIREDLRPAIERTFQVVETDSAAEGEPSVEADREADGVQRTAVRTLLADGAVVELTQPGAMRASENNLRRVLAGTWDQLPGDVRRMLITAEYFGDQVPEGFDHSGPVLGLFAACEYVVRQRLITPLAALVPAQFDRVTFGEMGVLLRRLPTSRAKHHRTARAWLASTDGDIEELAACGATIRKTNRWRIAAAHAELVDKATWDRSYTAVLSTEPGLLARLVAALPTG